MFTILTIMLRETLYFSVIFIGFSTIAFIKADGCNKNIPDAHYKEFGCVPELDEHSCPTRYDCTKAIQLLSDPEKCYFSGKQYNIGEKINEKLTQPNCIASAVCMKDSWRDFIYAHIDCPEFFGHPKLKEGCYRKYDIKNCCSTSTICPPFPEGLATCKVGDQTLREGQKFYLDDECLTCLCKKGYTGKNEAPFCEPITCGIALVKSVAFKKGAIPIYLEKRDCCPIGWIEYDDKKFKNVGKQLEGDADRTSCVFGSRIIAKGEKIAVERDSPNSPEVNCECQLPPRLTCFQKPYQ